LTTLLGLTHIYFTIDASHITAIYALLATLLHTLPLYTTTTDFNINDLHDVQSFTTCPYTSPTIPPLLLNNYLPQLFILPIPPDNGQLLKFSLPPDSQNKKLFCFNYNFSHSTSLPDTSLYTPNPYSSQNNFLHSQNQQQSDTPHQTDSCLRPCGLGVPYTLSHGLLVPLAFANDEGYVKPSSAPSISPVGGTVNNTVPQKEQTPSSPTITFTQSLNEPHIITPAHLISSPFGLDGSESRDESFDSSLDHQSSPQLTTDNTASIKVHF